MKSRGWDDAVLMADDHIPAGASCTKQMLDKLYRLHYGQKGQISRFDQMIGDEQNDAIAEIMMGGVL